MARAGYCSECESNVWLDDGGRCIHGHAPSSITDAYEVSESSVGVNPPGESGLFERIGDMLKGSAREMTPAEIELKQAELEHAQTLRQLEKNLKSVTKEWDKRLKQEEKSLGEAQAFGTARLGKYGGVTVWEHAVQTPHGTIDLERDQASASVETAGSLMENRRSTLTRMATGGLLMGPLGVLAGGMVKKKESRDSRELYLTIESASVASIVQCNADEGMQVRQLAAAINTASRGASARATRRQELVAQWTAHCRQVAAQRDAAVGEATRQLDTARAGTRRIDAARRALTIESSDSGAQSRG